jgi:hypothetical protein
MNMRRSQRNRPRPLTGSERRVLGRYFAQIDLDNARLHDGVVPWYLPKRFCAIARGNHIYFRPGVYQAGTAEGLALLGHEMMHVCQYRAGMTAVSYLRSALKGYMNSPFEKAADAVEARIRQDMK